MDYAIGRDIRSEDVKKISDTLQEWCDSCESVLQTIENQIDRANSAKAMRTKHTEDLEAEVCFILFFFALKVKQFSTENCWESCFFCWHLLYVFEFQIANLKKTLKTHLTDIDEDYTMDYKESTTSTTTASTTADSRIKKQKCKIMKPSSGGKSWFKF